MSFGTDLDSWLTAIAERHTPDIILGLERILNIAERLQLTHFDCPVITVAGTNGKGSTVGTLQRLYSTAGYRIGCYYSPHLHHFNERIQINNQSVDETVICDAFQTLSGEISDSPLTFFEFITLAALIIFKKNDLDILVLEVGLGGRLDAVNCVENNIAILTQIDFDHCDRLGDNREAIGFEKAGIFRENKIAICGDPSPPSSVINKAKQLSCDFYTLGKDFYIEQQGITWNWEMRGKELRNIATPRVPQTSVACAFVAAQLLQSSLPVTDQCLLDAAQNTTIAGRFEVIQDRCPIIFDVAHNRSAAELLAQKLRKEEHPGRTIALFSVLSDKDCKGMIEPMKGIIHEWHIFPLETPRARPTKEIIQHIKAMFEEACHHHSDAATMWQELKGRLTPQDRVVVYGSFYAVAAVQRIILDSAVGIVARGP